MTDQEIIGKVNFVFEESFEISKEKLQPQMRLFDDLGLDSLDIIDLVLSLQQEFKVKIRNDERFKTIRTLDDIYKFLIKLRSEGVLGNHPQ